MWRHVTAAARLLRCEMLSVKIICVGKLKEKFYIDGVKELSLIHISEPTRH